MPLIHTYHMKQTSAIILPINSIQVKKLKTYLKQQVFLLFILIFEVYICRLWPRLCTLLSNLNHSFSVIRLSETKIKYVGDPIINIDLPGYNLISQPTLSTAGGVGFFILKLLLLSIREKTYALLTMNMNLYGLKLRVLISITLSVVWIIEYI
jgi:hypothetical protein